MSAPQFPPLFHGLATAGADPLHVACAEAQKGCDAGLVAYDVQVDRMRAALVFAPEVALSEAMVMLPICGVGFQNALGALAPPEVGVHLDWRGGIWVNGAICGTLAPVASGRDPLAVPDWLVIGLDLSLMEMGTDTGLTPDVTALHSEGCADVEPHTLLEAWVRHTLVWINRWSEDGVRPVHSEWEGLAHGLKQETTQDAKTGTFAGVDEHFGMVLQHGTETTIIALTQTLQDIP